LYMVRAGFETLLVEKLTAGGQMTQTNEIDNYPGFEEGIDGFTLGMKMQQGAERFGVQTYYGEVTKLELSGELKSVFADGKLFQAKVVMLATGAEHRTLGLAHEESLIGKGVSYCATCDGMFYKGKTVAVVGGGNSAVSEALVLSRIVQKVIVVHRRDTLRASKIYHDRMLQMENIEFCWNSAVQEFLFQDKLTGIKIKNVQTGETQNLDVDGVFICIGRNPASELFREEVLCDDEGYVIADETTKTNLPGVFAIGDVRQKSVRQIVTATADGAVAAYYAERYLMGEE